VGRVSLLDVVTAGAKPVRAFVRAAAPAGSEREAPERPRTRSVSGTTGLLYTLVVGIPLCLVAVTFGMFLCLTIVRLPFGLTLIALGFKSLAPLP
jgi:uncharacterized membrane protein YccF (DUF307 family)